MAHEPYSNLEPLEEQGGKAPQRLPSVLPTQAKMPPDSHPFTVAISAAHSATGKNHRMPPMIRKNTS